MNGKVINISAAVTNAKYAEKFNRILHISLQDVDHDFKTVCSLVELNPLY